MPEVFINPLTDFGFKLLFGTEHNKNLLISFLNTLLPDYHQIENLTYTDSVQNNRTEAERGAVFDLHCKGKNGERFIIEMQRAPQGHFMDRLIYYATYPIREMAEKGEWDYKLNPLYSIGILNFDLPQKKHSKKIVLHHRLIDDEGEVSSANLNFITVELKKFTKENPDELENDFERWLYVLRHLDSLTQRPAALQERVFEQFFEQAKIAKLSLQERQSYEQSLKQHRDYKNTLDYAAYSAAKNARKEAEEAFAEERKQLNAEKQQAEAKAKVFELFYGQQKSKAEIAEMLQVSLTWVNEILP